jgi:hypothetical protein
MGQTGEFAASSWLVRQVASICLYPFRDFRPAELYLK